MPPDNDDALTPAELVQKYETERDPVDVRRARRKEILARLKSSGQVTDPAKQIELMTAIETWEYAGGDKELSGLRKATIGPLMSAGYVDMDQLIVEANKQIAAAENIDL